MDSLKLQVLIFRQCDSMIKNNRNNEQIYGRNDMIMLDPNNKIYGSLGLADKYVMKTEEGTRLTLSNPKLGSFANVLTEFNMYGRSEQKQYKGINLFPPNTRKSDFVEVSIPKGSSVFWVTDGTPAIGGNFRFFNEDKTENSWFGVDAASISKRMTLKIDVKYVQNLLDDFDQSKICLGVGTEPIYEPYVGGKPSPSLDYPQEIKSVVNPTVKVSSEDGTQSEIVTFPYTLNAIPVSSGGNVTINGQQWVCDEVDLERGVKVQRIKSVDISSLDKSFWVFRKDVDANVSATRYSNEAVIVDFRTRAPAMSNILPAGVGNVVNTFRLVATPLYLYQFNLDSSKFPTVESWVEYLEANTVLIIYALATPIETPLTPAEIAAFSAFTTYYPVTIVENNYNTWMKATYKSMESV